MESTHWTCRECKFRNVDYYDLTVVPMCGGCQEEFDWEEIEEELEDARE